jgi:O-antigen ligase
MSSIKQLRRYLILSDPEAETMSKKEKIFYGLFCCFLFSFFWPSVTVMNHVCIWSMVVLSFSSQRISDIITTLKARPAITLILAFCLLNIASAFISHDRYQALHALALRSPLFFLTLAIGTFNFPDTLKNRICLSLTLATTLAAIACLISGVSMSLVHHDTNYLYNDWLSDIIGTQSVYFAFMVTVSIVNCLYLLNTLPLIKKLKNGVYAIILFLLTVDFLLASRVQLLFLTVLVLVYAIYYLWIRQQKRILAMTMVVAWFLAAILMATIFPKTANRFNEFRYPKYSFTHVGMMSHYNMPVKSDQWNGLNTRLALWECSWQLVKDNFLAGVPIGDRQSALMKIYHDRGFMIAHERQLSPHNNFLDSIATFGIVGFALFMAGFFVLPLVSSWRARNFHGIVIIALFFFAMMTEVYLNKRLGCVMVGLLIPFIVSTTPHRIKDSSMVH